MKWNGYDKLTTCHANLCIKIHIVFPFNIVKSKNQ